MDAASANFSPLSKLAAQLRRASPDLIAIALVISNAARRGIFDRARNPLLPL